eukprot:8781030-Alexandrium_andersonii.AAC.1
MTSKGVFRASQDIVHSLKTFVTFWGGALAIHPQVHFLLTEEAANLHTVDEWFQEWEQLSYVRGYIPHVATSDICFALLPDLQWE